MYGLRIVLIYAIFGYILFPFMATSKSVRFVGVRLRNKARIYGQGYSGLTRPRFVYVSLVSCNYEN